MKINRRLSVALVVLAGFFTGCQEEIQTGVDSNSPAPEDFTYDLENSADKSLAVYWDASKAISAGAQSFTVQLTPDDNFNRGDNYDATVSKTLQITDDIYDSVTFSNLEEYSSFYVRVRANYPYSKYSEWVYLTYNSEPVPYAVGFGPIDPAAANLSNVAYDAASSAADKMAFTFENVSDASNVRIQLVNYTTSAVTNTVTIKPTDASVAFTSLKEGDQYQVRARTEYEENGVVRVSPWMDFTDMATNDAGESIETNVFEVGAGPVVPKDLPPVAQFVYASSSNMAFSWSESGFTSVAKDIKRPYLIELFKDAECTDLVVGWDIPAGDAVYTSRIPAFQFSGLDQNTTYYFRVTDTESGLTSEVVSGKTEEFTVVTVGDAKAAPGDVILAEDFSELIWGGNYMKRYFGYSATDRNKATAFDKASGLNGKDGKNWGWYLVDNTTEVGLFNTMASAVKNSRLATWGMITEAASYGGQICARPGMLKLGAGSYAAQIVTPVLSNLQETATVEVSFRAALYGTDNTSGGVYLVNTTESDTYIETYSEELVQSFPLNSSTDFQNETITVSNVSPNSRIAIGNVRTAGTTPGKDQQRMFVDNIVIKVVSYGSVAIELAKPVAEIGEVTDASVEVKWAEVTNATGYLVEYKKATDAEWTSVIASGTSYVIEGLEGETAYEVRVYATASGDNKSEASDVVTATTLKPAALELAAAFFSDAKVTWPANAAATGYVVYLNGSKVADVEAAATSYTYTGLSKGTEYKVQLGTLTASGETKSPELTFKTADIKQIKKNVGPTHICVDWDDCSGGSTNTEKLFLVELYKDAAATQLVYSVYTKDGQSAKGGSYGASSWMGKKGGSNIVPETRVTFGMLEPNTTYYFRVRTDGDEAFETQKGNFTMGSPNGDSAFSELVPVSTEASHVAVANEILYQGFDDITMQCDFINNSAGLTPYTTDKANQASWTEWCVYPFSTTHLLSTWGYAAKAAYVDGEALHNGYDNYLIGESAGTLAGWYFGNQTSPQMGYVKIGTSSKSKFYLATPALSSSLLEASGTPCTVSFKASALINDTREIYVEKYDAATKTFSTVKEITLQQQCVEGASATSNDYTFIGEWTSYSFDVTLAPGDNLAFVTKGNNRFAIDEILIVKK